MVVHENPARCVCALMQMVYYCLQLHWRWAWAARLWSFWVGQIRMCWHPPAGTLALQFLTQHRWCHFDCCHDVDPGRPHWYPQWLWSQHPDQTCLNRHHVVHLWYSHDHVGVAQLVPFPFGPCLLPLGHEKHGQELVGQAMYLVATIGYEVNNRALSAYHYNV